MRSILDRVAKGELTPQEAEELLAKRAAETGSAAESDAKPAPTSDSAAPAEAQASPSDDSAAQPHHADDSAAADTPPADDDTGSDIKGLMVRGNAVRLTIIGDANVPTAVAEGPHRSERQGDQLVIRSDLTDDTGAGEVPRSALMRWLDAGTRAGSALTVRVNPLLPLGVLVTAGSLELVGIQAPTSVGVEASSAHLTGSSGPLALSVSSGSADADWLCVGSCSVTAELGAARLNVMPGSDVRITASNTAGSATIVTAAGTAKAPTSGTSEAVVVGPGNGTLTAVARLGSVTVRVV